MTEEVKGGGNTKKNNKKQKQKKSKGNQQNFGVNGLNDNFSESGNSNASSYFSNK